MPAAPWITISTAAGTAAVVALLVAGSRMDAERLGRAGRLRPSTWAPLCWLVLGGLSLTLSFSELAELEPSPRAALFTVVAFGLVAAVLTRVTRRAARIGTTAALLAAATLLAIADLAYFRAFGRLLPAGALASAHQLPEVLPSAWKLVGPSGLWLTLIPGCGLLFTLERTTASRSRQPSRRGRRAVAVTCLALLLAASAQLAQALRKDSVRNVHEERIAAERIGVFNAHLLFLARRGLEAIPSFADAPPDRDAIAALLDQRQPTTAPAARPGSAPPSPANVLTIQLESLQQWVIGAVVDGQEVTPFLNALRERARYYPRLFDQTGPGSTSDAEYAVLNSQHPLQEGAIAYLGQDNRFYTLAHHLAARGYTTFAAHGYRRGYWNRGFLYPRYGFETALFQRELGKVPRLGWGLADAAFFERVLPEISALERPFFAHLVTLSLHHPFDQLPPELAELDLSSLEDELLSDYLQGARYVDRALAAFFERLETSGLLEDTVVVLYGDHIALTEPSDEMLRIAGVEDRDASTQTRLRRIPLFLVTPTGWRNRLPGDPASALGGHIDIAPTLLHVLGLPRPRSFLGRVLGGADRPVVALSDGAAVAPDRLFLPFGPGLPAEGACYRFPEAGRLRAKDCDELRLEARSELRLSRQIAVNDLYRELLVEGP